MMIIAEILCINNFQFTVTINGLQASVAYYEKCRIRLVHFILIKMHRI